MCYHKDMKKPDRRKLKKGAYTAVQWSWGLPQTLIGAALYLAHRKEDHFDYKGATATSWNREGAVSLGKFIFVPRRAGGQAGRFLLEHEYGHTLQSLILGPFYLLVVGFPSLIGCRLPLHDHRREWYEVWANRLSFRYHMKHGRESTAARWNHFDYPLVYRLDWYSVPTFLYYAALVALAITLFL